jgi:hypothetical protein
MSKGFITVNDLRKSLGLEPIDDPKPTRKSLAFEWLKENKRLDSVDGITVKEKVDEGLKAITKALEVGAIYGEPLIAEPLDDKEWKIAKEAMDRLGKSFTTGIGIGTGNSGDVGLDDWDTLDEVIEKSSSALERESFVKALKDL